MSIAHNRRAVAESTNVAKRRVQEALLDYAKDNNLVITGLHTEYFPCVKKCFAGLEGIPFTYNWEWAKSGTEMAKASEDARDAALQALKEK